MFAWLALSTNVEPAQRVWVCCELFGARSQVMIGVSFILEQLGREGSDLSSREGVSIVRTQLDVVFMCVVKRSKKSRGI